MGIILEVNNLTKKWKDFKIDDISFCVEGGYLTGFIGRNGAGKTTIMNLIMNTVKKNSGSIHIAGFDNQRQEEKAKNEIGFIMDSCPFFKENTLMENGIMLGGLYRNFNLEQFKKNLLRYNLDQNKKISELSKGMEIKFQLAFATSHKPSLLIMDEPTGGLDPIFRREFLGILQELMQEENMGIMLSTHITSDLDKIADYIIMIDKGKILLSESKEMLMERYKIIKGNKEQLEFIPKDKLIAVRKHTLGFEGMTQDAKEIEELIKGRLIIQKANLEDIMYYLSNSRKIS